MAFAPMLAATHEPKKYPLQFPLLASPKYDGIRCVIVDGVPMTRSLKKPVPNLFVRESLTGLPWFDGELIVGNPCDPEVCARTQSGIMAKAGEPDYYFYVFDLAHPKHAPLSYFQRHALAKDMVESYDSDRIRFVEHSLISGEDALLEYENLLLSQGYEGAMVRSLHGEYKHGRATAKQGALTKIKRFDDAEGIIIAVHEEMENANEAVINALGKTERSSHKAGKIGKNTLGGYTVRTTRLADDRFGLGGAEEVEFYLGASANCTAEWREAEWARDKAVSHLGCAVTFKYQPTPGADKPRFPVRKCFRGNE